MIEGTTNWGALGALAGLGSLAVVVLGILGRFLMNVLLTEIRKVTNQVTPAPNGRQPSTLAETVTRVETKVNQHVENDEVRFRNIWRQLGVPEPR